MTIALLICEIIFFILFMIDYAKLEKKFDELKRENEVLKEVNKKLETQRDAWEKAAKIYAKINPEPLEVSCVKALNKYLEEKTND